MARPAAAMEPCSLMAASKSALPGPIAAPDGKTIRIRTRGLSLISSLSSARRRFQPGLGMEGMDRYLLIKIAVAQSALRSSTRLFELLEALVKSPRLSLLPLGLLLLGLGGNAFAQATTNRQPESGQHAACVPARPADPRALPAIQGPERRVHAGKPGAERSLDADLRLARHPRLVSGV